MKRIVYGILVMIGCASCDPEIYMDGGHESEWFIKNTTDTPFSVSWTYGDIHEKVEISPGDSIAIGVVCSIQSIGDPKFSYITEIVGSDDDGGLTFYSEDGIPVRQDQQPQPDRKGYIDVTWVFDVLPEDLRK